MGAFAALPIVVGTVLTVTVLATPSAVTVATLGDAVVCNVDDGVLSSVSDVVVCDDQLVSRLQCVRGKAWISNP